MLSKVVRHCQMKKMVTFCQSYLVISMMAESAMLIRKLVKDTFQQMKVEVEKYKYKYKQLIQQIQIQQCNPKAHLLSGNSTHTHRLH